VSGNGKLPPNWQNFMRDNDNKTELFIFLADKIVRSKVIVTKEDDAVSTQTITMEELVSCSHDEADTQIFVHAIHAVRHGSKAMMIKASDTDVLVIAVSVLPFLQQSGLQQLWVSFGQRNNLCMNSVSPLAWQRLDKFCSDIQMPTSHSPDAMSYQPSVVNERSLHG